MTEERTSRRGAYIAAAVIVVATIVSAALRNAIPLNPIDLELAGLDGGLFERLAISIANHDWLGPFDNATLAKGPAYPIFLAMTKRLHIGVPLAHQLVYLAGALTLAACVWVVTKRPWAAAGVYVAMAFEPSNYSAISTQVTREHIYTGVALMFVCGTFLALYAAIHFKLLWWALGAAAWAGTGGAVFWLTREEGVWVGASLAFIGVALLALGLFEGRVREGIWIGQTEALRLLARVAVVGVVLLGTFVAPIKFVHMKNADKYGAGITTDFASGAFPEAYGAWSRVRGVPLRDFVVVNKAQRLAVYKVSPTAKLLEPIMEDPNNGWSKWGCPPDAIKAGNGAEALNICDDYPGGAQPWAFRAASVAIGKFNDEPSFQRFWGKIRDDINAACDAERLPCSRKLPSSIQLAQRASPGPVVRSALHWLRLLPTDPGLYQLITPEYLNQVSTPVRAKLAEGMHGVPKTQEANLKAVERFESYSWIYRLIGHTYRIVFPLLILLSIVGLAIGLFSRANRPGPLPLMVLAVALGGAVAARLLMFGVIATTQYFDNMRYELVSRSFLLALVSVGTVSALDQPWVRDMVARARASIG